MLELVLQGVLGCLSPFNLCVIVLSVSLGIIVGCLPGFGAATGLVLVLPMTYGMDPGTAFIALTGIYVGAEYGGSISAILINTPGTAAAVMTCLDGHTLASQGKARDALLVSNIASFSGGIIGGLVMLFCMPVLGNFVLHFGAGEVFILAAAGLLLVGGITKGSRVKGILSVCFGLFFTFFGADSVTGFSRFTFGSPVLVGGLPLIAGLLALFAVPQMLELAVAGSCPGAVLRGVTEDRRSNFFLFRHYLTLIYRSMPGVVVRSGLIGVLIGIIPGVGASVASMVSYSSAKHHSRHPEAFGTGALEGIVAPETSNNALVGGSLIPVLALGIPGSAAAAIYMGAIFLHGMAPGPNFMIRQADLIYLLIMAVFFCSLAQLLLGAVSIGSFAKILQVPVFRLFPVVIALCCVGAYAIRSLNFDITFFLWLGLAAYVLDTLGFNMSAIVLGAFLAPTMESSLMEALNIAPSMGGVLPYMASRTIALVLLALVVLWLTWMLYSSWKRSGSCTDVSGEKTECGPGAWKGERGTDLCAYLVVLLACIFFFWLSRDYPFQSRIFPHAVLFVATICSLCGVARCIFMGESYGGRDVSALTLIPWKRFVIFGMILVFYSVMIGAFGFYASSFVFFVVAQTVIRNRTMCAKDVVTDVLFSAAVVFIMYLLFTNVFLIDMPVSIGMDQEY